MCFIFTRLRKYRLADTRAITLRNPPRDSERTTDTKSNIKVPVHGIMNFHEERNMQNILYGIAIAIINANSFGS